VNRIYVKALLALAGPLLVAGCESTRLHDQGLKDVEQGQYESGVQKLRQAADRSPDNVNFRADLLGRQEEAVRKLIDAADKARSSGDLAAAEIDYRRVLAIEPGNDRAQRGVTALGYDQRHAAQAKEAQGAFKANDLDHADALVRSILSEDPGFAAAEALRVQIDMARGPVNVTPRLRTRDNRPVTLQFRDAQTKMVFEVLSRQTGINFIFDKDIRSDGKTTIFVQDVPIEQAIDLVIGQNQLARQVLSDNMVLIYPNTAAKQKDYQDQIVKTFYLNTAAPKDVESLLKTVLDIKTMVINERANAIVVRETPEVVRMAEKLVASVDIAEPEVMLEVEVLEISRTKLQQLGINYPTSFGIATPSNLVIADYLNRNGSAINRNTISASSLAVTIDALKTTGNTNTLASPRIRARNKEKAKILIGSRVPSITSALTPTGLAGGGVVANQQVQYLDVGLTLEVEPTIYADNDVAIKINLEVSSIVNTVKNPATGSQVYEIGTRNATTLLQLKDGETQILAGLIKDSDTQSASKIPGLGDIPVVGRLFADHTHDKQKSEIVLSITPRIIRGRERPASDTSEFWFGTESRSGLAPLAAPTSRPASGAGVPMPAAPMSAPALGGGGTANVSSTGGGSDAFVGSGAVATPAGMAGSQPASSGGLAVPPSQRLAALSGVAEVPSARPAEPDGPAPKVASTLAGPSELKVGDEFTVTLQLETDQPLKRARTQLRWDASAFQLLGGDPGSAVPAESGTKVIGRPGGAQMDFNSTDYPVAAGGELVVLKFKALQARPSTAFAAQLSVMGNSGTIVGSSTPSPLSVKVGN
jgi:general secretion pathway protein D